MEHEYLNSTEAAALIGVTDKTIRNLCRDRKIKHERLNGRNLRFKKEWIDDYLQSLIVEPIKNEKRRMRKNEK